MKVGIYARVSTQEQQTLPLQLKDLREYAKRRKWKVEIEISDVASGAKKRPKREELLKLARQRKKSNYKAGFKVIPEFDCLAQMFLLNKKAFILTLYL